MTTESPHPLPHQYPILAARASPCARVREGPGSTGWLGLGLEREVERGNTVFNISKLVAGLFSLHAGECTTHLAETCVSRHLVPHTKLLRGGSKARVEGDTILG